MGEIRTEDKQNEDVVNVQTHIQLETVLVIYGVQGTGVRSLLVTMTRNPRGQRPGLYSKHLIWASEEGMPFITS